MKTVKIINGAYAAHVGGRTVLVRLGNTCQVEDQEAARLVGLGVAAYVEGPPAALPQEPEPKKPKKPGKAKAEDPLPDLAPEGPVA